MSNTKPNANELFAQAAEMYDEYNPKDRDYLIPLQGAAELGHNDAQFKLGCIKFVKGDYNEAAQWFELVTQNSEHEKSIEAQSYLDSIHTLDA